MNLSLLWHLKTSAFIATGILSSTLSGPAGLLKKIEARLKIDGAERGAKIVRRVGKLFIPSENAMLEAIEKGEYSTALQLYNDAGLLDRIRYRSSAARAKSMLGLLLEPPEKSLTPMSDFEPTVLALFTNSLPESHGGYAYRTQTVLEVWGSLDIPYTAYTRFGFPVVVGRYPKSREEIVRNVSYNRMIDWVSLKSPIRRIEQTTKHLVKAGVEGGHNLLFTTTDYQNALAVSRAAAQLKIPWIYEVRGELENTWASRRASFGDERPEKSEHYRLAQLAETEAMKAAYKVVVLSEVSKRNIAERGVPISKIEVIPNAVRACQVDTNQHSGNDLRAELQLDNRIVIGSVSSLVEYEGFDILIRSMEVLDDNVHLLLVGDGPFRSELDEIARESPNHERIHIVGRQPNETISQWYELFDVFVIPRLDRKVCRNVTPMKALEAQLLGKAIVASELEAIIEVTGGVGVYVPPGDPVELAKGIEVAIDNKERYGLLSAEWARTRTTNLMEKRYSSLFNLPSREDC